MVPINPALEVLICQQNTDVQVKCKGREKTELGISHLITTIMSPNSNLNPRERPGSAQKKRL